MNLTEKSVRELQTDGKDRVIVDDAAPGFILRVRANGRKSYGIQYRRNRRLIRSVLGDVATLKVAPTRARAKILLGRIEAGEDVTAELSRRGGHVGATCTEFFETYAAARNAAGKWHGPRTEESYRGIWARHLAPCIGKAAVSRVDEADVDAIARSCKGKRSAVAGALRLLRAMLNLAEKRKLRPRGSNCVQNEMIYVAPRRVVHLSAADYHRLGAELDKAEAERTVSPHVALAIRLLALTGARKLEICAAKWAWYDEASAALHLPTSKTGAKSIVIPAAGRRLLADAQRVEGQPFIVAGHRPAGRAGNVDRCWYKVRAAAGLPKLRIHDLRHGWASTAAKLQVSYPSIAAALGHAVPGITASYVHVSAVDVRPSVEIVGAWIADALAGRPANLLNFPGAAERVEVA